MVFLVQERLRQRTTHLEDVVRDDSGSDDHNDLPEEQDKGSNGVNGSYTQSIRGLNEHKQGCKRSKWRIDVLIDFNWLIDFN